MKTTERQGIKMRQIIGYMEYDIRNIKQGLGLMAAILGGVSVISMHNGNSVLAMVYPFFCAIILCSTFFNVTKTGPLIFSSLLPGTNLQKILGRFLGEAVIIAACTVFWLATSRVMGIFGNDTDTPFPIVAIVLGITLFSVACQNVMLYLVGSLLGVQLIGLIRMLPGFIMFFGLMFFVDKMDGAGLEGIFNTISGNMERIGLAALAAGLFSMVIGIFLSWIILQHKDEV